MFLPRLNLKTGSKGIIFFTLPEWNWAKSVFSFEKNFSFLNVKIKYDTRGLICGPVLGAPMLGILMEVLKRLGISQLIGMGWVAKIGQKVRIEDLFIPCKAYSLEGTTKMCFRNKRVFFPEKELYQWLTNKLKDRKIDYKSGNILSIDAPFIFEKNEQIIKKWENKVDCVDMETSCFFSLGEFLNIRTVALHFITDEIGSFKHTRSEEKIRKYRQNLIDIISDFFGYEF